MAKAMYKKFGSNYSIAGQSVLLDSKSYSIPYGKFETIYRNEFKTNSMPTIIALVAAGIGFFTAYFSAKKFHKKVLNTSGVSLTFIDLSLAAYGASFDKYMYDYVSYLSRNQQKKFHFKYTNYNVNTGTANGWKVQTIYEFWIE